MEDNPHSTATSGGPVPDVAQGPLPGVDVITGALSIARFGQEFGKIVSSGKYDQLALWFVDIRNFRAINPKYGFETGNRVLRTAVDCIREVLSQDLPVARLGGDRFVMLTAGMDYEEAQRRYERLAVLLQERVLKQGVSYPVALCAGVYYLRAIDVQNASLQVPLDYASIAHRNAHEDPSIGLIRFTEDDLERDKRRIIIEHSIDDALRDGQIEVWYQPQVDYVLGEVVGAEALARWNHPELGWISAAEFIPILEGCGKVHELDLYVWEDACRSAGKWYGMADGTPVPISVNVSQTELFESGLLEHFLELQAKYGLPRGSLRLEVTERAFVEEADRLYRVVDCMRENDVLVEMDDFGSGLSSLNMLKDAPVDVVKLDMGFMRAEASSNRGGVVLGSVIRMLQALDTPIIAGGVETLEQAETLKNMGCHLMQGYHFSRPMPLGEFETFIASNRAVEHAQRRERSDAHLGELTKVDAVSSYFFNHVMGPTMLFFAGEGTSESILVNDDFYDACGLERSVFGNTKVNPIAEIEPSSRATMWRAAAEARERGTAQCRAEVLRTKRWLDCVMRYLGSSARGDIFSLNIVRSGSAEEEHERMQVVQDLMWDIDMLDAIVPNGFVKCQIADPLVINYFSPKVYVESGLTESEFVMRFHNALDDLIVPENRSELIKAVSESRRTGKRFSRNLTIHYGYGSKRRDVDVTGRVSRDSDGVEWLYMLILFSGDPYDSDIETQRASGVTTITFEYDYERDFLVIHAPQDDGEVRDIAFEQFVVSLDPMSEKLSKASAAKVVAMVRDLRQHPTAGFCDIKCDLRGEGELRWYHINYTCEMDEQGNTTMVHGYAQDANDKMGSARWWRQQAERDQLTGLLNRNAIEQNINISIRMQGSGMMFMIDLDGFKLVNDEQGHLAGDALLRDVARALHRNFREGDMLGRYGGDEFVAFMAFAGDAEDAYRLAERKAQALIASVKSVHAACSVGVAILSTHEATFYDLLEVADEAMYKSKEAGKGTYTILTL